MLPLRKLGSLNRSNASIVLRPCRIRRRPQSTKATPDTIVTAKAIGMGERSNGQVHPPIVGAVSVVHQP